MKLDPRIKSIFDHRSPAEQFLAIALCALLETTHQLDEVIESFVQKEADWTEHVTPGRPLLFFNGKTVANLIAAGEPAKTIATVVEMYEARDLTYELGNLASLSAEQRKQYAKLLAHLGWKEGVVSKPAPAAQTPTGGEKSPEGEGEQAGGEKAPDEPLFGGRKLSEYAGKTDAQLLEMDNVGPATVTAIRDAEAKAKAAK